MKKISFIAIFIVFVLFVTPTLALEYDTMTCTETDSGKDFYNAGALTAKMMGIQLGEGQQVTDNAYVVEVTSDTTADFTILLVTKQVDLGGEYTYETFLGPIYVTINDIIYYGPGDTNNKINFDLKYTGEDQCGMSYDGQLHQNPNILNEKFCSSSENSAEMLYECEGGCSAGACIPSTETGEPAVENVTGEGGWGASEPLPIGGSSGGVAVGVITQASTEIVGSPGGGGQGIYGIYAELGDIFKLQKTQPVKIIDYLDDDNNPLRIYLINIYEEYQEIRLEVLFNDDSEVILLKPGSSEEIFGAVIYFKSIDENWEYATLQVSAPESTETPVQARVRTVERIRELETVKPNVAAEHAVRVEQAQDTILEVETEAEEIEEEIDERGFGYKVRWLFGRVAEQEKEDAVFFEKQAIHMNETAQLLLEVSEQVGEPAKSVLLEQAEKLQEKSQEFSKRAYEKQAGARGILSWFGRD